MKEWFSGVVRGKTTNDKGKDVRVRHLYLVDATDFTEAENVLVNERFSMYKEPMVLSLKREVIETIHDECDTEKAVWWKVVVALLWMDSKGREKQTKYTHMVSAETAETARESVAKKMKGTMDDWKIVKIEATGVKEVLVYEEKKPKDELR